MENFGIGGPLRKLITSEYFVSYYAFTEINDVVRYGGDYERAWAIALDDNEAEDISLGLGSPSVDCRYLNSAQDSAIYHVYTTVIIR